MIRFLTRLLAALAVLGATVAAQGGPPVPQHLTFAPFHSSGIDDVGETIGWTVSAAVAPTRVGRSAPRPVMAGLGFIDTISSPAGVWTMLNPVKGPVEAWPMIGSEHDTLTRVLGRACPARTTAILSDLVHGGTAQPATAR